MLCYNRESLMSIINTLTCNIKSFNTGKIISLYSQTDLQYGNRNTLVQVFTATKTQKKILTLRTFFKGIYI